MAQTTDEQTITEEQLTSYTSESTAPVAGEAAAQRLQEAQARGERTSVRQKEVDVYVMSMGDGLLLERMQVCKMLWDAGIKAEFLYKKKPKLQQQFAVVDKEQIPLAVLLAPGEWANGTVRVKQQLGKDEAGDDKGTEVPLTELAAFVQTKLSPSS